MPESFLASLRGAARASALAVCTLALLASSAAAQQPTVPRDTARARADSARSATDTARADTTRVQGPRRARAAVAPRPGLEPPISPRRAFISSLLVPGLGQARLDRPSAGALFVTVELAAIAMATKAVYDLRAAKAFRADSVVLSYPVDTATGLPAARPPRGEGPFPNELVRARRLHLEDWLAVLGFNHLIAGAEAFVAANLWDLPAQVGAQRSARGPAVVVTVPW
ncbi:MAG: hypothetical protein ACXW0Z_13050 [Gemmatirosa sp.]